MDISITDTAPATLLLWYLLVINIVTLIVYGMDKKRAEKHRWRIRERILILLAFAGGGLGALAGMSIFHHKTRKWKFRMLVPAAIIFWTALIIFLLR